MKDKEKEQASTNSLPSLKKNSNIYFNRVEKNYEVSIYRGDLTPGCIVDNYAKIKKSFPSLPVDFFEVFSERIKENNFCDSRLIESVKFVVDNCVYPVPTIAQFITFDKRIKVYYYEDIVKKLDDNRKAFESYIAVKVNDEQPKPLYVHVNDFEKFNLTRWKNGTDNIKK